MKNIWGLTIIIAFATVLFLGVSEVNNQILSTNGNLNDDSRTIIEKYDSQVQNLSALQSQRVNTDLSSNTTNNVEAFYREYAESKNNFQKFKTGINYIWDLPEIIILAVPLIDVDNGGFITILKGIFWFLIGTLILLVGYKAIRTGEVDDK